MEGSPDLDSLFRSIEVTIEASNSTSRVEIPLGSLKLIELGERGLALEGPKTCCAKGHNLVLKFEVSPPDSEKFSFATTARAEAVTPIDATARIDVSLLQFDEKLWQRLQACFGSRQDQIDRFLSAARGY